uniref:Uncharacterized protein n=1 Tax=Haptolina brevifila TaxID=156173 RepID=A0A7S2CM04_9EUKA|mmetsp:Transcript_26350/g.52910  ORF Transcript_26350/g.52910 Transcript_26350/m.52910 type:complete len:311 (+) Transcript_26350:26-958(+)
MERPDSLDTSDVEGAQTRRPPVRYTAHPFNSNDDIELSRPSCRTANPRSQRCTDPIMPVYKLPSSIHEPLPAETNPARDVLWTLPQHKWRSSGRSPVELTPPEMYGRTHLFQQQVQPLRPCLQVSDITGPQFRTEERRWRDTDPLMPAYVYDGGPVDDIKLRRPRPGSKFVRAADEEFALRTDDIINEEKVGCKEYPKYRIKTRIANRTDDILGAQANTWCSYPRLWKARDPSELMEKVTNRVTDVEGAVTGTANKYTPSGGGAPPLYRSRIQAVRTGAPSMPYAHLDVPAPVPSTAARDADIQAVRALP